jgi:hypothetical protein
VRRGGGGRKRRGGEAEADRIRVETISDCKQGVTETGGKEITVDLRGRGGGGAKLRSLSPYRHSSWEVR